MRLPIGPGPRRDPLRSGPSTTASTSGVPKRENVAAFIGVTLSNVTDVNLGPSGGGKGEYWISVFRLAELSAPGRYLQTA
jgi:hypothetical protein